MTMAEIDKLREDLDACRATLRNRRAGLEEGHNSWRDVDATDAAEYIVACAERNVEAALRKWWAQDCKEIGK